MVDVALPRGKALTGHRTSRARGGLRLPGTLKVFVVFGLVALIADLPSWPGDSSRIRGGDLSLAAWFLAWWPHALLHGHNPFFTNAMNFPAGMNVADNPSIPLLSILAAPITLTAGPIASLNVLIWLAFPLSGCSMYYVLRRWGAGAAGAFVGSAFYGFSPYIRGQNLNHLVVAFIPLPPLILLCVHELVVRRRGRPIRHGIALALLVVAQYLISQEIVVTTAFVAVIGVVVLGVARPRQFVPVVRYCWRGVLVAAAISGVLLAYPLHAAVAGPYHFNGPTHPGGLGADLEGIVVPTSMTWWAPSSWIAHGDSLVNGNIPENGSYLGGPLLLLCFYLVVRFRKNRWIPFAALLATLTWVLSLGWKLQVGNHQTAVTLPWRIIQNAPLVGNLLAIRMSLFVDFFVAILLALGITEFLRVRARDVLPDGGSATVASSRGRRRLLETIAVAAVSAVAVLSLLPRWPYHRTDLADVPTYFTSSAVDAIPQGSVVLISPYPSVAETGPELWVAEAGIRFAMIGGYSAFTDQLGHADMFPRVLQPSAVESFLWGEATGGPGYPTATRPPELNARLEAQFATFLRTHQVGTVVDTGAGAHPQQIRALFSAVLGPPSATVGTTMAWYDVPKRLA